MKTNRYIFYLILFILPSCQKILDKEPLGILDAGSFFKTAEDAKQAINSAYKPLLFCSSNNNFYWGFAELPSDEAIVGGDGSRPGLTELDFFTYTPRTEEFNDFWILNYNGITQCNTIIEKVPVINMDDVLKKRILGEAYFLRAYYYFLLTQVYGDVPLLTKLTPPDELRVPSTARADIYNQIILDCDLAASYLPTQYSAIDIGRATQGAAFGLAAKTSLYAKNWPKVLDYIAKIKAIGIYALMPDYEDNFRKETQNNSESVWEIQHTNLELGVGNSINQWWSSKKYTEGYGFAEVTQQCFDAFEAGDPRRKFTLAMNNEDYFGVVYKKSFSSTGFSVRKYLQDNTTLTQKADGDINYTAIRYAEVLLWEAEANTELNNITEAQKPLEEVRARARAQAVDPTTALPVINITDQETMRTAVRHERQVELAFEMHRFFDLVRWGIAAQTLAGFQVGKHEVFPLPQTEIDLNPNMKQNPNY
ncbi:MAG TPA: RagB/SusD family nutrient uptake outer membrane protein [Saprospiraceae bacterium]|nr:RagB/SusD family nutrient uptake outer membrane protein [Saprospiraceae bacterium]